MLETIFTRAGQGDEQAQQLIHLSARTLARLIADIKATTDCQCVVVGGSVGLAEGYLALVEMYLAQEPAAFMLIYWRRITAMMQVYLGLRCWAQGEKIDDGVKYSHYRLLGYILRYRTR
ncbi:putative transcriptional regulator [Escherichia coli]|uniref:Putative transcriptional regulator n=1 Tax=Escherichia coli TaxID=562 RepID=A0A376RD06_ECOLX|nr:putative transcriptional regulator [Escherichia coli]